MSKNKAEIHITLDKEEEGARVLVAAHGSPYEMIGMLVGFMEAKMENAAIVEVALSMVQKKVFSEAKGNMTKEILVDKTEHAK